MSPYSIFKNWLFDSIPDSDFPFEIQKAINPMSVLCMFGEIEEVTIYLNDNFNKFSLMKLDNVEFYKFIKEIVIFKKIRHGDLSFFNLKSSDKDIKKLKNKLPLFKSYEIRYILEKYEEHEHFEYFEELMEIKKEKKTLNKVTKKDLALFEKSDKISISNEIVMNEEEKEINKSTEIKTWTELKKYFQTTGVEI